MDYKKNSSIVEIEEELITLLNLIISRFLKKYKKKKALKVYEMPTLPKAKKTLKVYEIPTIPPEHELIPEIEIPDNYYVTNTTQVKHLAIKGYYEKIYDRVTAAVDARIEEKVSYVDIKNYRELFAAMGRSVITELYEKYYTEDEISLITSIVMEFVDALKIYEIDYSSDKLFKELV